MAPPDNAAPARELHLTRVFPAPRELVFQAWTDPRHLAAWWGPQGFSNPVCQVDARPAGAIRIHMRAPNGVVYPMVGTFREVVPPERVVFASAALNAKGEPILEAINTVVLTEAGGHTTLTLHVRVTRVADEAKMHLAGMNVGWNQSIDRLAVWVGPNQAAGSG